MRKRTPNELVVDAAMCCSEDELKLMQETLRMIFKRRFPSVKPGPAPNEGSKLPLDREFKE